MTYCSTGTDQCLNQPHLRSFYCSLTQRPKNGSVEEETLEHSLLNGMSSWAPPLKPQGYLWKRMHRLYKPEGRDDSKEMVSYTTGLTYIQTHRQWSKRRQACRGLSQTGYIEREAWRQAPIPTWEASCNWHLLAKEKSVFSNGVSLCILTPCRGIVSKHKRSSTVFLHFSFV